VEQVSWPECGETIAPIFLCTEVPPLRCVLPKGHQYDGDPMHLDGPTATRWQWTIIPADGDVVEMDGVWRTVSR
jgi:hypothetical protein